MTPTWNTLAWYPQLTGMLIENLPLLPKQKDIFKYPLGKHPLVMNNSIKLAAWPISGKPLFLRNLTNCFPVYDRVRKNHPHLAINRRGESWVGWCGGEQISPFHCDISHIFSFLGKLFQAGWVSNYLFKLHSHFHLPGANLRCYY